MSNYRASVVIPIRDEDWAIIAKLKTDLHTAGGYEVIVVDDGSVTPYPYPTVLRLDPPVGYGAALKLGIQTATCPIIVTMDGDGQHSVEDVNRLVDFFTYFDADMVIGDRRLKERGLRLCGRKFLNWTATLFTGRWIPDLNSGLRVFKRQIMLGYFPILSDKFSFTTSSTLSMLADGYKVDWLPIKVSPRKFGLSKVHVWSDGWRTLKLIIWIGLALRTRWLRQWLRPLWAWTRA